MTSTSLTFGPFRLIPGKRLLLRSNQPVRLPRKAYEILLLLLERSGQIVLKRELIERVTSGAPIGESQIRVYISKLRRALEDGQKGMRYVENVNSHGYRFIAPGDAPLRSIGSPWGTMRNPPEHCSRMR